MKLLEQLIVQAANLAGGNSCALGHDWQSVGGRACPRKSDNGRHSQTVYQCARCGEWDYGDPGGPAHAECFGDDPNGCSRHCTAVAA